MQFEFVQTIGAPLAGILDAFGDPLYYDALAALPDLNSPVLLERHEVGDVVTVRVRLAYTGRVSPAVARLVSPEKLTWVTELQIDRESGDICFTVEPDHYPDRLSGQGVHRLVATGASTRRMTSGEVRVRLPIVYARAERALVTGFGRHLTLEGEILEEWLVA